MSGLAAKNEPYVDSQSIFRDGPGKWPKLPNLQREWPMPDNQIIGMLQQEVVIEMSDSFPFGGLGYNLPPGFQVLVRKVVRYTKDSQKRIRLQLDILRRLPTDSLVKLVRVLEEPGKLHLFYQYVPYWLQPVCSAASQDTLENLKLKMIELANCFYQLGLKVPLTIANAGLSCNMDIKYFVGLDFEVVSQPRADIHNEYTKQINLMWRDLEPAGRGLRTPFQKISYKKSESPESTAAANVQQNLSSRPQQHYWWDAQTRHQSHSPNKSVGSRNGSAQKRSRATNTLEILSQIESKIDRLRGNIKNSQILQEGKQSPNSPKPSKKDSKWIKPNDRRLSGQPSNLADLCKQVHSSMDSPKSLRTPQVGGLGKEGQSPSQGMSPTASDSKYRFQRCMSKNGEKFVDCSDTLSSKLKEPRSKTDFEQIKKIEFENFFQSKEKYVHEFLDVLEDDGQSSNINTQTGQSTHGKSTALAVPPSNTSLTGPPSSRRQKNSAEESRSPNNDERHQQLLERISRVIQQSALALERYHRNAAGSRPECLKQQPC